MSKVTVKTTNEKELKDHILTELKKYKLTPPASKDEIREFYSNIREERIVSASRWFMSKEDKLLSFFANGDEIVPEEITPYLVPVENPLQVNLFRYATLLWSVPVSSGYGKRMRFLVFDKANGKLIGLFGLGDPVYNLGVRDEWIGWDVKGKNARLYHVMDAFVLGAVPPYSFLLCGKLVAMLVASNEVREFFAKRYSVQRSIICGVIRPPYLVLITTTSALGKSSLYNRISFNGNKLYHSVGYTEGWGHSHLPNGTFKLMKEYLRAREDPIVDQYRYGGGPNWRFRVIKKCLMHLGLSPNLLYHGLKREVFVIPLAQNTREFLRGEVKEPLYYDISVREITEYFRRRWLLPRASWDDRYKDFKKESIRLSTILEEEKLC